MSKPRLVPSEVTLASVDDYTAFVKHPAIPTSYTILKEDSTYYALPCFSGGTKYSGADAATVIQAAINAVTNGGTVQLKQATYNVATTILRKKANIVGEGVTNTLLNWTGGINDTMIEFTEDRGGFMKDFSMEGNNVAGVVALKPVNCGTDGLRHFHLNRMRIGGFAVGLHQGENDSAPNRWYDSVVRDVYFWHNLVAYECTEIGLQFDGCKFFSDGSADHVGVRFANPANPYSLPMGRFNTCSWRENITDLYFDKGTNNRTIMAILKNCYFEKSTNGIVDADIAATVVRLLEFDGCWLHSDSTSYLGDFSNFSANGMVSFKDSYFKLVSSRSVDKGFTFGASTINRVFNEGCFGDIDGSTYVKWVNSGTSAIVSGQTHVHVTHGLATTPAKVFVQPTAKSTADPTFYIWVSDIGATEFIVNCQVDPGVLTLPFMWEAKV